MTAGQAQRVCDDHGFVTRTEDGKLLALVSSSVRDSSGRPQFVQEWETVPTSSVAALQSWLGY